MVRTHARHQRDFHETPETESRVITTQCHFSTRPCVQIQTGSSLSMVVPSSTGRRPQYPAQPAPRRTSVTHTQYFILFLAGFAAGNSNLPAVSWYRATRGTGFFGAATQGTY